MFVTSNILIHVNKHMYTIYDGNFDDTSIKLKTIVLNKNVLEEIFIDSCRNGNIKLAKWLVSLGVDIHAKNEQAFQLSCAKGHIEIAKWLVSLGVDVHAEHEYAFHWSCENGHIG
jgi:ankyrin repeat protein